MSKKLKDEPKPLDSTAAVLDAPLPAVQSVEVRDLFKRSINATAQVRSLTLKRVLTRPLVSMSHTKQLAVIVQSEMYTMPLNITGRGGGTGEVRVFDAIDATSEDEVIVICHQIMCSALQRAGYRTLGFVQSEKDGDSFPEVAGKPLKGAKFAFLSGDVVDGKRYRQVSVAELE